MLSSHRGISGLYDAGRRGPFTFAPPDRLASLFGVPAASPRIFSDLNGLFLMAVGVGYYFPWRYAGGIAATCG